MSDLLILGILGTATVWSLWRPWIGAVLFVWVSLMSPHVEFGWSAANWPVATGIAACTLVGLLLTKQKQNPMVGSPAWAILFFTLWICITLPFSFYLDESLPLWERSMKIFLMIFVTLALIDDKRKLHWLIWTIAFSIGFYTVKGGLFTLMTAGNYRVWGPGGFIGGNNELALAGVMTIPLLRYIQLQMVGKWQRRAMGLALVLSVITVLGSYSRGAFLALAMMGLMLWMKGKRKFVGAFVMLFIGIGALGFMPEQWFERMNTIETYQQDESAMGRLNAWGMATNLALDRIVGGGFMPYHPDVYARYAEDPNRVLAAHSIYFQILGEHGFIGLFLFLGVGLTTWATARRLIKSVHNDPSRQWLADLGAMVQVSLLGYAVGGTFLSLAYFDLPYYLAAIVALAASIDQKQRRAALKAQRAALGDNNMGLGWNHGR
ncbi:putative O-glycosylation ligase, exosortase A system-associated [Aquincola tertiaricarbonis]|uniref:putative O-glycosylation ligase, exosortase A system-associated n=1 Tax=Aquincola tertiaricarbonis TaxID=391953 RepID=UPI000614D080|nr:putative O-glycosylation ligase, exosortase A system-associated [Aquincola tertiaricarbonis]